MSSSEAEARKKKVPLEMGGRAARDEDEVGCLDVNGVVLVWVMRDVEMSRPVERFLG